MTRCNGKRRMIGTLERAAVNGGNRQHRQCFSQLLRLCLSMLSERIITRADVTKFTVRPGFPMPDKNQACGGQLDTPPLWNYYYRLALMLRRTTGYQQGS